MHEPVVAAPWLEHAGGGEDVEKTLVESFPFTIGRKENADLSINSTRVSRDHAVITRQGKKYHLHDLGSTNGTYLNGQRIQEQVLSDGDQVMFAEVEFTFFSGEPSIDRDTATQAMTHVISNEDNSIRSQILAVRRIHEAVTRRGVRVSYQPIVELETGDLFGYEALAWRGDGDEPQARCEQWTLGHESRAAVRLRKLFRRLAVEEVVSMPSGRLLLALVAGECDGAGILQQVCQLRDLAGSNHQLVVEIPSVAVQDDAQYRALRVALRSEHVEVAYDGYASGKAQISDQMAVAPDYLKLAPSLMRSLRQGQDRQRQVQMMIRASHDLGSQVIATGIDDDTDLEVCRKLNCDLVQGNFVAHTQANASGNRRSAQLATNRPGK